MGVGNERQINNDLYSPVTSAVTFGFSSLDTGAFTLTTENMSGIFPAICEADATWLERLDAASLTLPGLPMPATPQVSPQRSFVCVAFAAIAAV